jgi:hypothetical protein
MLVVCKLGPTTQYVKGRDYEFRADGSGQFVCEVHDDQLVVFLARPEVYELAQGEGLSVHAAPQTPFDEDVPAANVADIITLTPERRRRRRGRPVGSGIDDRVSLMEIAKLKEAGVGLSAAAALVVSRLENAGTKNPISVRKRLLRKVRELKSRY